MNQVDTAIAYLLEEDDVGLGTNGKTVGGPGWGGGSGGGGYAGSGGGRYAGSGGGRRSSDGGRTFRDIIGGITDMTSTITGGVVEARRARYGRGGAAAPSGGRVDDGDLDLLGDSGVDVRTPWGRIFIGGAAILVIGGVVVWAVTKEGKPPASR